MFLLSFSPIHSNPDDSPAGNAGPIRQPVGGDQQWANRGQAGGEREFESRLGFGTLLNDVPGIPLDVLVDPLL